MNKLLGFYELKYLSVPTVPWKEFTQHTALDPNFLWTIRTALLKGNDINLPRAVGVTATEGEIKGKEFLNKFGDFGLVVYYPFFIAEKSGIVEIKRDTLIIEACKQDLWNLVTYGCREVTLFVNDGEINEKGNKGFLTLEEIQQLIEYSLKVKRKFKDYIEEGKSLLLEWSFAFHSDPNKNAFGDRYLVFYELRTIDN